MSSSITRLIRLSVGCRRDKLLGLRYFYDWRTRSESIFALATSIQQSKGSPLAIIRISGPATSNVIRSIIQRDPLKSDSTTEQYLKTAIKPRYATLTKIRDPNNDELIDMGLVLWFPSPHSYTGEDSCELHIHGSQATVKRLLAILGEYPKMRPAEPGEFTRRAFENGKISLMQAESLPDLISAQTDQQRKLALQGLVGATRAKYEHWIDTMVKLLAHLEASIDFGEDELIGEQQVVAECKQKITYLAREITSFISVSSRCKDLIQSGARVTILGRPNAGKSTLMNILCRHEKSIVSDLSGTTRDVIQHSFELGGHTLLLSDTAGLKNLGQAKNRNTSEQSVIEQHDAIEREGIKRALNAAKEADLIIYLVDGSTLRVDHNDNFSQVISEELNQVMDADILKESRRALQLVINKLDLKQEVIDKLNLDQLESDLRYKLQSERITATMISCKTQKNIETLVENITKSLNELHMDKSNLEDQRLDYVNERHLALLRSVSRHLNRASQLDFYTTDEMAQHVRESVDYLSRIVGFVSNEQVIDIIFRDFCIGK